MDYQASSVSLSHQGSQGQSSVFLGKISPGELEGSHQPVLVPSVRGIKSQVRRKFSNTKFHQTDRNMTFPPSKGGSGGVPEKRRSDKSTLTLDVLMTSEILELKC